MAQPQKLIRYGHLPRQWFLTVVGAVLLLVSGCTPFITRGDILEKIDEINNSSNLPPVADAGVDQVVPTGTPYILDGSASTDPNSDPLTYFWTFLPPLPAGSGLTDANIVNAATATPSFTPDVDGTYTLELLVDDGEITDIDTVDITAATANLPPVADAGVDQNVFTGNMANLDGSASTDPDLDPLNYLWTFLSVPGGSILTNADILNPATAAPSFTPDVDGTYTLQLQVDDGIDNDTDTVDITAATANLPPVADAGVDQNVFTGNMANLDGSASTDPDLDPLNYLWTFLSVPGGSILTNADILNPATAAPSFTPDVDGTYTLQLQVDDGVDNDTDTVDITAATANLPPVADAGVDQNVFTGNMANLDGSASTDPDLDPLNYLWTFLSVPGGSILVNADILNPATAAPSFTPDVDGTYTLQLQVDDGVDNDTDTVDITAVNDPPVANAGVDIGTLVGSSVALDGSGSSDSNPTDTLIYSWSFISVPGASSLINADIAGAITATPSFTPDVLGDYVLELAVSDGTANAIDQVTVSAHPPTLVGEWMFSNGLANDTGPFGYNGIVNNAVPTTDRAGNPNSAFYFNGVNANIVLGNGAELNYTDLMSFSCWFRADNLGSAGRLVSKRSSPVAAGWEINIGSTDKITTNNAGTLNAQVDNPGIIQGTWHHLAFTWDPNATAPVITLNLYLDGVYLSSANLYAGAASEPPVSAEPLTLGMPAYAAVLLFEGAIDDVRFYHRILSPAEVTALATEPAIP